MNSKLSEIKSKGVPFVKSGRASDAKQFFEMVIKNQFSAVDSIKAMHKVLMQYVNREDAVFVLRLYGSDSKGNYEKLRRGFLTQYPNGCKMVFCDNTFAMPFAVMKLAGICYTANELIAYMNDSSTCFGFCSTKEEQELAYYNWNANKANINLNDYGWYLAHIVPIGKEYSLGRLRDFFQNPDRADWIASPDKIRREKVPLAPNSLSVLKAHFLRIVHPLNSFLVPKISLLAYNGNNIGEEQELINIVQNYIKNKFPQEYAELSLLMLQSAVVEKDVHSIGTIVWDNSEFSIVKKRSKFKASKKSKVNTEMGNETDIFDIDEVQKLDNTLKSIGKGVFMKLYPLIKENPSISIEDVIKKIPEYGSYTIDSQKSRLSSTKSIIRRGLGNDAIDIIAYSKRVKESMRLQQDIDALRD